MPRMTNTYMAAGPHTHDEIISSVKNGLYCASFGGGQVDISNGNFVFEVREGYRIEDGKITSPVKNATLIGVGPEAMKNVSMVGDNPELDPGSVMWKTVKPYRLELGCPPSAWTILRSVAPA